MIIRYLNVQHWTNDKQAGLALHLTLGNPDIILLTSTSRTREHGPIKIPLYNTFTTNKHNERHAGAGIAIKYGVNFELLNSFQSKRIIDTPHPRIEDEFSFIFLFFFLINLH